MSEPENGKTRGLQQGVLILLALLAAGAGLCRLLKYVDHEGFQDILLSLGVGGALLLLGEVKSLAFGDLKLELERTKAKVEEAASEAKSAKKDAEVARNSATEATTKAEAAKEEATTARNNATEAGTKATTAIKAAEIAKEQAQTSQATAQVSALGVGGKREGKPESITAAVRQVEGDDSKRLVATDDPNKGRFGSRNASLTRELQATVTQSPNSSEIFIVSIELRSKDQEKNPLTGFAQFFLHDTFQNPEPIVAVGPDGVARLSVKAWGAFTVGAVADEGRTRLELDLATLDDAPPLFKSR